MFEVTPFFEEVAQGLAYPEGPFWSERDQCLYFVEWNGNRVCRLQNGRVETVFSTGNGSGPCGLCQDETGHFWVCLYSACRLTQYDQDGSVLKSIDRCGTSLFKGPNDLALHPQGGLYFTDSGNFDEDWVSGRPAGGVYYLNPSGDIYQVASDLCYSNGVAISNDATRLWVNEHRKNQLLVFSILEAGSLSPPAILSRLDDVCLLEPELSYELGPDGMCLDGQGCIWLAHFGGGKIVGVNQAGEILHRLPVRRGRRPTNISWSPRSNSLFITEAEFGLIYRLDLEQLEKFRP